MTKSLILALYLTVTARLASAEPCDATAYFSPRGGATAAAVSAINAAARSIDFEAYQFTSAPILSALESAAGRGVKIRAVYDRNNRNSKKTLADELAQAVKSAPVLCSPQPVMHSKVLIIDNRKVVFGSFNWTRAAEQSNNECLVILESPVIAAQFTHAFEMILASARR